MPYDPELVVGEILGQAAYRGIQPETADFSCPYTKSRCIKRSTALGGENPYPVCSIWRNPKNKDSERDLICVCPKRFYQVNFLNDVIEHCWSGEKPKNPKIAPEVKMRGFGNVDFVIADIDKDNQVDRFLSVELQAIDITGSVMPAYNALLLGEMLNKKPTYGFNWDNVYKRYITQLIRKGFYHHHWNTKIVAVMQEQVYRYVCERADFMRSTDVTDKTVNIIFMAYKFEPNPERPGQFAPVLSSVEGTSHANLQAAILYKEPPSRDAFCEQIKRSLSR